MRSFILQPRPPYRLDLTVWVLRRLPVNVMDRWDGETYRRVLVVDGIPVEVTVRQLGSATAPQLRVELQGGQITSSIKKCVRDALTKTLGLNIDLASFHRMAGADPKLADLIRRYVGFKPPRLPTIFETMVNGIACQQISLSAGLQLLNRFCATWGWHGMGSMRSPVQMSCTWPRSKSCEHWGSVTERANGFLIAPVG